MQAWDKLDDIKQRARAWVVSVFFAETFIDDIFVYTYSIEIFFFFIYNKKVQLLKMRLIYKS